MSGRKLVSLLIVLAVSSAIGAQEQTVVEGREGLDPAVVTLIEESVAAVHAAPESTAAWSRLCMAFEANLLWPEAAECYQRLSNIDIGNALWRHHEAIAQIELGGVEAARTLLEKAVALQPDLLASSERLGYLLIEQGELDAARQRFEDLIDRLPQRTAGYLGAGEVALLQGQPAAAAEYLETAVELDSLSAAARYQLGLAYRALKRIEEAERQLAVGVGAERRYLSSPLADEISTYSVHISAQVERAAALLQEGRDAEAGEVLEELLERSPENTTLINDLAIAYMRLDRLSESRALLDRALEIDERSFSTHLNLSAWAGYAGRSDMAVDFARSAVELAPSVAATHLALARALGDRRYMETSEQPMVDRAEMLAEMERAISIGVEAPDAHLQMARELWRGGRIDSAFEALDDAVERWPDFWPAELMRSWILVRAERYDEAAVALERVRAEMPEHPDVATLDRLIAEAAAGGEG